MENPAFDVANNCWSGEQAMKGGHLLFLPSDLSLKCGASAGDGGSYTVVLPKPVDGSGFEVSGGPKNDFYFLLDRDGVSESAIGFDDVGKLGDFGEFPEPVVDTGGVVVSGIQAQGQQKAANGVKSQVEAKGLEQLEPKLLTTRSGRVCRLSKKVEENLDNAKVVKKVEKRPPVNCKMCNESFIGLKSLWRHLVQFPDHGSLPDNGEVLEKILNHPDKKKPAKPGAKGKKRAVGKSQTTAASEAPSSAVQCPMSRPDEAGDSGVVFNDGPSGGLKPKEEIDLFEDVEALKQAFLKKCSEFTLGDLFIVRTETKADDGETSASLATPHGRRFLAMLKDLERLVDALKYAAELSFVLEETDLTEGVLKVDGTLSDILAIAEGVYKPVCDVKEIMVLVREKLKPDSEQRHSRFGNSSQQHQPQKKLPEVIPLSGPTESKKKETSKVMVKRRKKVVKVKKVVKSSSVVVQQKEQQRQLVNHVSTSSISTSTSCVDLPPPVVTSASSSSRPLQLTIDAVVQRVEEVPVPSSSSSSLPPGSDFEDNAMQEHPTVISLSSDVHGDLHRFISAGEDSNIVPTESLSPSLKGVDESVTKDAMTILSEDMNEASNSSDIGSVLIPVTEMNGSGSKNHHTSNLVEPFTSTYGTITVERRPSMDDFLPPSVPISAHPVQERRREKKQNGQTKRSYSSSKSMKAKKVKEDMLVVTSVSVSTPNDDIQVLQILPPSNRPFKNVSAFSRDLQPPVFVHHEPFLNPNSLPRTCPTSSSPSSSSSSASSNGHFMPPPSPDATSGIARRLDFTISLENGTSNGNGLLPRPKRPVSRMSPPVTTSCAVCASSGMDQHQQPSTTCVQNLQELQHQQSPQQQQQQKRNGYHPAHPPPPYTSYNFSKTPVPPPYPVIGSPDKLSALPSHMISSYPKYRVASASSGSLCTVVDSTRKAISPGLSIRLPSSPIPQPGPLPSPSRMSLRSPHAQQQHQRLRQTNTDEELVESELEDSDREADHHGIDSDLESVTNAFVEGRLMSRPPDAHSENSNSSVVDFEQLMRDIDIPTDINYYPRATTPLTSLPAPAGFLLPSSSPSPSPNASVNHQRTASLFRPQQAVSPSIPFALHSGINACHRDLQQQHLHSSLTPNPSLSSSAMSM